MREEKEGRKKQARSYKQHGKATQHTQGSHFSQEKRAASGGTRTHDTLYSRQSALPLSYQGSTGGGAQITCVMMAVYVCECVSECVSV